MWLSLRQLLLSPWQQETCSNHWQREWTTFPSLRRQSQPTRFVSQINCSLLWSYYFVCTCVLSPWQHKLLQYHHSLSLTSRALNLNLITICVYHAHSSPPTGYQPDRSAKKDTQATRPDHRRWPLGGVPFYSQATHLLLQDASCWAYLQEHTWNQSIRCWGWSRSTTVGDDYENYIWTTAITCRELHLNNHRDWFQRHSPTSEVWHLVSISTAIYPYSWGNKKLDGIAVVYRVFLCMKQAIISHIAFPVLLVVKAFWMGSADLVSSLPVYIATMRKNGTVEWCQQPRHFVW